MSTETFKKMKRRLILAEAGVTTFIGYFLYECKETAEIPLYVVCLVIWGYKLIDTIFSKES
jgi:hypothetical protein